MRYTFEQVRQHAAARNVFVQRSNRSRCKYEVSRMNDDSSVEECQTLQEVVDAIPEFAQNVVVFEGPMSDLLQNHLDTVQMM